jgi:hypothetical protein
MRWGGIARFRIGEPPMPFHGTGCGEDPRRANLNRHQLHDGVQLAGRVLSDYMSDPRHHADRRRDDRQQRQQERGLSTQLHDPTDQLPGALRTHFTVAVARRGSN